MVVRDTTCEVYKQKETNTLETLLRGESDACAFLAPLREGSHEAERHSSSTLSQQCSCLSIVYASNANTSIPFSSEPWKELKLIVPLPPVHIIVVAVSTVGRCAVSQMITVVLTDMPVTS